MLPRIDPYHSYNSQVYPPHPALPMALLTVQKVVKRTQYQDWHSHSLRRLNQFHWLEDERSASLNARISYINGLVRKVQDLQFPTQQPLTLISLGSGGLLMERYIDDQLKAAGYHQLRWRCIDLSYARSQDNLENQHYQERLAAFQASTLSALEDYPTEQAYLHSGPEHSIRSVLDRAAGPVILLSIHPPGPLCALNELMPADWQTANTLYLMCSQPDKLADAPSTRSGSGFASRPEDGCTMLFCRLTGPDDFRLSSSAGEAGDTLLKYSQPFFDAFRAQVACGQTRINMQTLSEIMARLKQQLEADGRQGVKSVLASDYHAGLANLCHFFRDSPLPVLKASLQHNVTHFTLPSDF